MQLTTNPASVAIAAAAVNLAEIADVAGGPNAVAIGIVPNLTALAAAETVTLQIIRNDTGAVIGNCVVTNPGAGASTMGPAVVIAPIPAGMAGAITLQSVGSVATGNTVGSATAPIVLMVLP